MFEYLYESEKRDVYNDVKNAINFIFRHHRTGDGDAYGERLEPERAEERYSYLCRVINKLQTLTDEEKKDLTLEVDKHILGISYVEEEVEEKTGLTFETLQEKEVARKRIKEMVENNPIEAVKKRIEAIEVFYRNKCTNNEYIIELDIEMKYNHLKDIIKRIEGIRPEEKSALLGEVDKSVARLPEIKNEVIEAKKQEKAAFDDAKRRYKEKGFFERWMYRIKGQSPDKLPRDLSKKELDQLYI